MPNEYSYDGLFYDAAIETNFDLLKKLNIEPVYGNSWQTLNDCKSPATFFTKLDQHSIPYPEVSFEDTVSDRDTWLAKEQSTTGGVGVSPFLEKGDSFASCYLQKKISGITFSVTFLANANEIVVLGFNTLWAEALNENMPYVYAGAINQVKLNNDVLASAQHYTETITKEFKLIGLNSIDFIFNGHSINVLEINPRIPATYELYETKSGELLGEHIEVCKSRALPIEKRPVMLRAHAIVYAPHDVQIPESMSWPLWTADRPHDGEQILQYEPICSVFAGAKNSAQVSEMIKTRKQSIISKLIQ